MSTLWHKALLYLGLVDEEEAEREAVGRAAAAQAQVRTVHPGSGGGVPGRRVEPPAGVRRRMADDPDMAEAGVLVQPPHGSVRALSGRGVRCEVVVASAFNDAQLLADRLRARVPVVLDLRNTDPDMVRRLIDFSSGLTYALEGTMRKVGQGVILVLPSRMALSGEERDRLTELGLYQLSEG